MLLYVIAGAIGYLVKEISIIEKSKPKEKPEFPEEPKLTEEPVPPVPPEEPI